MLRKKAITINKVRICFGYRSDTDRLRHESEYFLTRKRGMRQQDNQSPALGAERILVILTGAENNNVWELERLRDSLTIRTRGSLHLMYGRTTILTRLPMCDEQGAIMSVIIHELSDVQSTKIGDATKIWHYVVVMKNAVVGSDCTIWPHCFIDNDVNIGDRVTIKCGVHIGNGSLIEDDVLIGPNTTVGTAPHPPGDHCPGEPGKTIVHQGASIGANAAILAGTVIGRYSMVDAGAVVTHNVPPNAIVAGNPARITGSVATTAASQSLLARARENHVGTLRTSSIPGVQFFRLPVIPDMRGSLSFAEYGQYLPFIPKRFFLVFDVPSREIRGEHAHRKLHQFLVCVKGACSVMVDDGRVREEYVLDTPGYALHIPPMVWGVQYEYSHDAVLLVLASDIYNPDDYIRDYGQFLELVSA